MSSLDLRNALSNQDSSLVKCVCSQSSTFHIMSSHRYLFCSLNFCTFLLLVSLPSLLSLFLTSKI